MCFGWFHAWKTHYTDRFWSWRDKLFHIACVHFLWCWRIGVPGCVKAWAQSREATGTFVMICVRLVVKRSLMFVIFILFPLSKSSINWMAQWAQCYKCCGLAVGDSMLHADRFHMILIVAIGSRVLVVVFHAIPMKCFSGCSCPPGTACKVWIQRSTENCIQGR